MNFSELKQELFARGTNYLEEDAAGVARAERWLNQAYQEIANLHSWPFLKTSATGVDGAGEVSIPDLRKILYVADVSGSQSVLHKATIEELVGDDDSLLSDTGTPYWWYQDGTLIKAFPHSGTIYVRYVKRLQNLTGNDTPVFADQYHNLIVDRAMVKAYIDSDNYDAAAALKQEFNDGVLAMAEDYLQNSREVSYIQVVDPYDG